jgi:hypothetical protein
MTQADTTHSRDYIILKGRVGEDYARELVEESAIDPTVALERGYYMVTQPYHLVEDLGYPERWFKPWYVSRSKPLPDTEYLPPSYFDNEVWLPALVIPKRSADNERVIHEIKPCDHTFKDDRKYFFPQAGVGPRHSPLGVRAPQGHLCSRLDHGGSKEG